MQLFQRFSSEIKKLTFMCVFLLQIVSPCLIGYNKQEHLLKSLSLSFHFIYLNHGSKGGSLSQKLNTSLHEKKSRMGLSIQKRTHLFVLRPPHVSFTRRRLSLIQNLLTLLKSQQPGFVIFEKFKGFHQNADQLHAKRNRSIVKKQRSLVD